MRKMLFAFIIGAAFLALIMKDDQSRKRRAEGQGEKSPQENPISDTQPIVEIKNFEEKSKFLRSGIFNTWSVGSIAGVLTIVAFILGGLVWFVNDAGKTKDNVAKVFNRDDFWTGNWSMNAEYLLPADYDKYNLGAPGFDRLVMNLSATENGVVEGLVLSKNLCQQNPITWNFFVDSHGPGLLSLGSSRDFVLSFQRDGRKVFAAMLRAEIVENKGRIKVIRFTVRENPSGIPFPPIAVFAKNLPAFQDDSEQVTAECQKYRLDFHKEIRKSMEKGK
ncbi:MULTISPECIES: hypothetical protein [unclassified Acidovorax]|uniref:hypothetical protein n=1 Tax=unclassified Acidovorax TaxID=2684926 RepID=UPI001C46C7D2|nr:MULTISPECIES: hypothetical protein [unclassified Acidovorax]MBV7426769.1 hypothetical protein [Acidovorax sp. sif0732]MBV7447894.1 hypothetical protein [Acidovorax sp. sif0715]